jgi:hypothetical protein
MLDPQTRDRLSAWIADFTEGDGMADYPAVVHEAAGPLLEAWLVAACERRDCEPADLGPDDLRSALLETVARLDLPGAVHERVPDLCRDLLAELEAAGRLGDGRVLGLQVAAQREAYARAVQGRPDPITRPGAKIGRNDPCPCGSGQKYKKCCGR